MSKYDFDLDLSEKTSTGMILNRIKKGSTVLEFGCAAGRMTRYMKEVLDCKVYIVEYDRGAFEQALEFAQDGVCDDIQKFVWVEQFGDIRFDDIIFADVLEHLTQPELVLQKAAALLKEDGCIHVTVPNITHNDIILKMFEERFDYTQIGLLDDTHVHFWGLENIKQLGHDAGLCVRTVERTPCATGDTEQNVRLGKNRLLENMLRQRPAGEAYQFVVTLDNHGCESPTCDVFAADISCYLYLDTGHDFNPEECMRITASYQGDGSYAVHYVVEDAASLCRVRLDPVEYQGVLLRSLSISQNGTELPLITPNGISVAEGIYLPGDDPMVIAQVQPAQGAVSVDAEFVLPGEEYLRVLEQIAKNKHDKVTELETQVTCYGHEICNLRDSVEQLQKETVKLHGEKTQLEYQTAMQNRKIAEQEKMIRTAEETCRQLRVDVSAYIVLTNEKEKIAIGLERDLQMMQTQRDEYSRLAAERQYYIEELEKSLNYYRNLRVVRLRAFVLRVLRKIKRCMKKLLGRIN